MAKDNQDLMTGEEQAKARDKWIDSRDGKSCRAEFAAGHYLEGRLMLAFVAGMDAALSHVKKKGGKKQ